MPHKNERTPAERAEDHARRFRVTSGGAIAPPDNPPPSNPDYFFALRYFADRFFAPRYFP